VGGARGGAGVRGATSTSPLGIEPSRSEAEKFLISLTGVDAEMTFQTFDDNPERKDLALIRILHGSLVEHWDELVRLNLNGAGIFVMVNEGDGNGRKKANVRALRALFVDDDTGGLEPAALEITPSIVVQSKRGLHAYWRLRAGEPLDRFEPAQVALAAKLGTDASVKDLSRVMRLPGFLHQKPDNPAPFLVTVIQASDVAYTTAEALEGFGIPPQTEKPPRARKAPRPHATGGSRYKEFKRWAEDNGEAILTQHDFNARIAQVPNVGSGRTGKARLWVGIRIRSAPVQGEVELEARA